MKGFYIRAKYLLFLFIFLWLGNGCKKEGSSVPTYVHIDSFKFIPSPLVPSGVANSTQITAVWAYYNNNPIGVFDLPATIPVIASDNGVLTLRPGIAVSGFNNFMAPYPFYESDTSTLAPQPGKTVNYQPKTTYYPDCRFNFISSFDPFTGSKFATVNNTVPIIATSTGIGQITLSGPKDTLAEDSSTVSFQIPLNKDAYIELDYKCDIPFYIGLRANLAGLVFTKYYLAGVYPSDHWQKFYLAIKDFEAQYQATDYTLFIKASLPDTSGTGTVLLDNIQMVYFN